MRMRKLKRAAAGLLAGLMLVTAAGCGDGGENSVWDPEIGGATEQEEADAAAKGRFIETLKETPDGVSSIEDMVRLADGSAAFLNPDTGELYTSKDNGDHWEARELPALADTVANESNEVTSMAVAPDGGVFFSYVDWGAKQEGSVNEIYHYIDKDGNDSEIPLSDASGTFTFYLSEAKFTSERKLTAFMNGGPAYEIDLDAASVAQMDLPYVFAGDGVEASGPTSMFVAGDYVLSEDFLYQVSAKASVEDAALCDFVGEASKGYRGMAACFDEAENMMYVASADGFYSHVLGGSMMEKLLDSGMSNLGDPTKQVVSVLKNEDGSFLMAYDDGEIDLYTYDKDATSAPSRQITVYSLRQNLLVSKAVSMFRKSHPDVFVKQEVGIAGDYGVTEEDAVKNLNTKLLSDEGPDLLILDDMPVDSYIEKRMLLDLDETVKDLERSGHYFSNILRAYQSDNGLYAAPFRFRIPVIAGAKERVEGFSGGMASLADEVKKAREDLLNADTVLGSYTAEELLKRLYMAGADALLDSGGKDGGSSEKKLDRDAVKVFLEKAVEIYEAEQKNLTDEKLRQHEEGMNWRINYDLVADVENFRVNASGLFEFVSGQQALILAKLSGMTDLQMIEALSENKEGSAYELLAGTEGGLFSPNGIIGINANTKQQELATDFLRELLGTDVQKADLDTGFPVNADAYDKFTETSNPESTIGFSAAEVSEDGTSQPVHFTAKWPGEEAVARLKEKIGKLDIPTLSDGAVYRAVLEAGTKVLEGDMGIEEGCDAIASKIELYLAE